MMADNVIAVKPCVLCGGVMSCHCAFKAPKKGKWVRKSEIWTTSPRRMAEILQELHENYRASVKGECEFIFKFTAVEITHVPPATPKCSAAIATDGARKSNELDGK